MLDALIADNWQAQGFAVLQIAVSMLLGGLIGYERELADKPAGFRTHMLVAGAATLFMGLGTDWIASFDAAQNAAVRIDPLRVMAAIITGVSFLGAGTIFRRGGGPRVEGLTTAATIWLAAAVGIAGGMGQWLTAIGVTIIALLVLRGMKVVDRLHNRGSHSR